MMNRIVSVTLSAMDSSSLTSSSESGLVAG